MPDSGSSSSWRWGIVEASLASKGEVAGKTRSGGQMALEDRNRMGLGVEIEGWDHAVTIFIVHSKEGQRPVPAVLDGRCGTRDAARRG